MELAYPTWRPACTAFGAHCTDPVCFTLPLLAPAQGFPSGFAGLAAMVFQGTLLAFGGLYLLFWYKLNLMQTMPLALMLGGVLFISGHFALRGIAAARLKKD